MLFFRYYDYLRDLNVLTPSFPTRRSAGLVHRRAADAPHAAGVEPRVHLHDRHAGLGIAGEDRALHRRRTAPARQDRAVDRSEEHTSELQSLMRISYAVFCLKKKKMQH